MSWRPAGLLREAVSIKEVEVAMIEETLKERPDHPLNLRRAFFAPRTTHRYSQALRRRDGTIAVIAAVKRFQPQPGGERPRRVAALDDIGRDVRALELEGVDAAMVYTDSMRYGVETVEMLRISREVQNSNTDLGIPLSRNDIIIDPIQIAEAAEAGACCVNLIAAAALPDLFELLNSATAMGIEAVVECHTEFERDFAIECGATLLYLTNRDRTRNYIVPGTAERLVEEVPPWVVKIGGGGLATARDAWTLLDAGFQAVIFGETLMQSRGAQRFIDEIRSQRRLPADPFADVAMPFAEE